MKIEQSIKQKAFSTDLERALVNIMYTSNWFRDNQMRFLKDYALLTQHYNTLRIIKGKYPDPISPSEINAVLLDKSNDTTRLVDKLVRMKLVHKNLCPSNRRKMDITITEAGINLLDEINSRLEGMLKTIGQRLTNQEAILLSDLLDKLRED